MGEAEEDWWRKWIENGNDTLYSGNRSTDVICANCLSHPDFIACLRSVIVAILAIITAWICFFRILTLHSTQPSHIRLLLYFILCIHCLSGSFDWLLGWNTHLALFSAYAKAVELIVICYYYLDIASRMMHWSSAAGRRLCFVALFLMFSFFTLFLVMGLVLSIEPWTDCHAPYWVWFSAGEFSIVQLMVSSFFLILYKMRRIAASSNIERSQRLDLLSLFWAFELSVMADLCYHISLFMLADDSKGCSGVFKNDQMRYSVLKGLYDIFSFLIPIWAILYVFRPRYRGRSDSVTSSEFLNPSLNGDSTFATLAEVVVVRNWRKRYRPLRQPNSFERPVMPGTGRVRSSQRLRQVSSSPAISAVRRASVSRSLVSSPLYSIPEEIHHIRNAPEEEQLARSFDRCSNNPAVNDFP